MTRCSATMTTTSTPLYLDALEANGFWSYAFVDRQDGRRINITWDKKTKTMSENIEDLAPEATKP